MREYLLQDDHIFQSLFPDQSRAGEISKGVYRVELLERQFLMWKVKPLVTLNISTIREGGQDALPESTCVQLGVSDIVLQGSWLGQSPPRLWGRKKKTSKAGLGWAGLDGVLFIRFFSPERQVWRASSAPKTFSWR